MAPLKYEDQLKEKLEIRRLQPSENAWEKLSNRLDKEDKKHQKPYWWLGLAASIVGVIFIGSQFFNNHTIVEEPIKVVTIPEVNVKKHEATITITTEDLKPIEELTFTIDKIKIIEKYEDENLIKSTINDAYKVATNPKKENDSNRIGIAQEIKFLKNTLTFEEQKIQEVVAQVTILKNQNNDVTDDEINVLLNQAQKEIKLNRLLNETTGVVDANVLLQDVEAELDQSFRSKVFDAIKSSYNSVKTAVAQRNN